MIKITTSDHLADAIHRFLANSYYAVSLFLEASHEIHKVNLKRLLASLAPLENYSFFNCSVVFSIALFAGWSFWYLYRKNKKLGNELNSLKRKLSTMNKAQKKDDNTK